MNKRISKIFSLTIALLLCVAMAAPAMAIGGTNGASTSVTITKNLILGEHGVVPKDKEFTFTLTGDASGSTNDFEIHAGSVDGVTVAAAETGYTADVTSTGTDSKTIKVKFGTNNDPAATTASNKKTVAKKFTIDFAGVTFTEPGVYRYKLTETADDAYTTTNGTLYIDVYVEYAKTGDTTYASELSIGSILVHTGETYSGAGTNNNSGKNDGSVNNETISYDLDLEKKVTGNQGSQIDFFKFTVTLSNVPDGTYTITGTNGDGSTYTPVSTIVVTNGNGTATIYLKHGQKITIEDLPKGAKYTITEEIPAGYTVAIGLDGAGAAGVQTAPGTGKTEEATGMSGNTSVTYTNTRNGIIPTGVLMTIAPFVALMFIGLVGVVLVLKKKKN